MPTKVCVSPHDMDGESTREYDRRKKYGKYNRSCYRYSECCERVVNPTEKARDITDKKQHKRSSSPKKMIIDKVDRFTNSFHERYIFCFSEFWYHKFEIGTPP